MRVHACVHMLLVSLAVAPSDLVVRLSPTMSAADGAAAAPAIVPDPSRVSSAPRTTPGQTLRFEVASIKLLRNPAGPSAAAIAPPGRPTSRFNHGGSIRALLQRAYGIPYVQQIGGPEWIREDTYIIAATIPETVEGTPANINAMIRALLADRFKLVIREETRELPIYELVHARGDKALGPNLTPVGPECLVPDSKCPRRMSSGRGTIEARNQSVQDLARVLEFDVGRPVVERTGLTGRYDVSLKYADAFSAAGGSELASLFTATQEQLGLRLASTRGAVKVLVVDSIERPTED